MFAADGSGMSNQEAQLDKPRPTRIMIADEKSEIRQALKRILGEKPDQFECVAEASNGQEAIDVCKIARPDILLISPVIPVIDGVTVKMILEGELPDVDVLLLVEPNGPAMNCPVIYIYTTDPDNASKVIGQLQEAAERRKNQIRTMTRHYAQKLLLRELNIVVLQSIHEDAVQIAKSLWTIPGIDVCRVTISINPPEVTQLLNGEAEVDLLIESSEHKVNPPIVKKDHPNTKIIIFDFAPEPDQIEGANVVLPSRSSQLRVLREEIIKLFIPKDKSG